VTVREAVFIDHPSFAAAAWPGLHPLAFARQASVKALAGAMGWLSAEALVEAPQPARATLLRFHSYY
jgi:hypothetical protein